MKRFLYLFGLIVSVSAYAQDSDLGIYAGLNFGQAGDHSSGAEKLEGPSHGYLLGYRWTHWAIELGINKFRMTSKGGQTNYAYVDKATINADSYDFIVRAFYFKYLTAGIGYSKVDAKHEFKYSSILGNPANSLAHSEDQGYNGTVLQLGLVYPIFERAELQALYEFRSWSIDGEFDDNQIKTLGGDFTKLSAQVVYYF